MFKDFKTGGYSLESSRANHQRLTSLILLISLADVGSSIIGKKLKNQGLQPFVARPKEPKISHKRHSDFWGTICWKEGNSHRF